VNLKYFKVDFSLYLTAGKKVILKYARGA